jgi:iron complex outermembrane receptor protein
MSQKKRPATAFARKSCVVATQFALALMAAPAVMAQQTAAESKERIEVTGTRIQSPNIESTSPVAVITSEDIKFEGVRSVENLLNNLPQVFADQGGNVSNGASGTATVNLRNLGADRTLVLVNGKRMPAGTPRGPVATDLNAIPLPLIERVEVLTGGASAIYGSDAVAGVVNFIMRKDFEGVMGEVNYSFYQHEQSNGLAAVVAGRAAGNPVQFRVPGDVDHDGEQTDVSLTIGGNFANNKGNATVFFGYKKDNAVLQSERDYSACTIGSTATAFTCSGSGTSFPGRFINLATGAGYTVADAAGNVRPFVTNDQYNFGPLNYFQRPAERYTAAAFAHYDINPSVRTYGEFMFHDDHTVAQIAPSGWFANDVITLHGDNPLLTPAWRAALGVTGTTQADTADLLLFRRNVEGGGRQDDIRHTSFRTVVGVKGDIFKNWDYDVYAQTGKVLYQEIYRNEFSVTRTRRAFDVTTDPATGAPVCRSVLDGTDPNCVPYNLYRLGGVTQAALDYVQVPGLQKGYTSQSVQGATLSSDLSNYGMRLPGAKSGIGVAVGMERRVEKLQLDTDSSFTSNDLAGQGGPTIGLSGQYDVKEFFGEARIPIMEGRPMFELLSVNGSYRYADYSTGKSTDSYGLGLEWAPTKTVKMRASYQQAVRAANIIELFQARGIALFDNDEDPCAGATPTRSFASCARTGVTAAQYGRIIDNPAGQYNYLQGGNPNLEPETAKSYTLGLVLTPTRNLSATLDYFHITVEDVINNAPPTTILQQCLDTGSPAFCSLIHRDQLGTFWALPTGFIEATNQNLSKKKTSGIDVSVTYNQPLAAMGKLGINFIGTWLKEFKSIDIPGQPEYDCAGLYGSGVCGTPLPEWRHKLRFTWNTPWNVDASLTWRYFSSVLFERTSSNPVLTGTVNEPDRELAAQNYIDLAAQWSITKNIQLRGGINNLLDRDPPISAQVGAGFGNGNTFPQVYDALGRRIFVGVTVQF